jgi:hypothetical protein
MAVTDRIFISTQQDIQLLDFILKQKSSEAIALITCVLLHLIFCRQEVLSDY